MVRYYRRAAMAVALALGGVSLSDAATVTVSTLNDVLDCPPLSQTSITELTNNPGTDGLISLREAMLAAMNNAGADTVNFAVSGTIQPSPIYGALPSLSIGSNTIDGGGQITIDGSLLVSGASGFTLSSSSSTIKNVKIIRFTVHGIVITGESAVFNTIQGCTIGEVGNGNSRNGILIANGANRNTIGGDSVAERNVIGANGFSGIEINNGSNENEIIGNYIGLDVSGTSDAGNTQLGIVISQASQNIIQANHVAGNTLEGIKVAGGNSDSNVIKGNVVGLNAAGTAAIPNARGIYFENPGSLNLIGGTTVADRNVVSGNTGWGILLSNSENVSVYGNYIGTNPAGTAGIPNTLGGVYVGGGAANAIGGGAAGQGNLISGNSGRGVALEGASIIAVQGNVIGLNAAGTAALGNGEGVHVYSDSSDNLIGGTSAGQGNVISGNTQFGIRVDNLGSYHTGTDIMGNMIGTNAEGDSDLGNGSDGIYVQDSMTDLDIGDAGAGRNVISGNGGSGIMFEGATIDDVTIANNYIGVNAAGDKAIENDFYGIYARTGLSAVTIGGITSGLGNVVSGNKKAGILLEAVTGGEIHGNTIGMNAEGIKPIPNSGAGISLSDSSNSFNIGGPSLAQRNYISGNAESGIDIGLSGVNNVTIAGNNIGTNADGTDAVPNGLHGIDAAGNCSNVTIGGTTLLARNLVSGNTGNGIRVRGTSVSIKGNAIGVKANLSGPLGNGENGVLVFAPSIPAGPVAIGGVNAGEPNLIASNTLAGVSLSGPLATGSTILRNAIFNNGGKGIELLNNANSGAVAPVFSVGAGNLTFSAPNGVQVEFFADTDDEGREYLGTFTGTGSPVIIPEVQLAPNAGKKVTATSSTVPTGTSEFSIAVPLNKPEIIVQPISRQAVNGLPFSISVSVSSALAVSHQWKFDNGTGFVDLFNGQGGVSGANGPELSVSAASAANEGTYVCTLTNEAGEVETIPATVEVVAADTGDVVVNTLSTNVDSSSLDTVANLISSPGDDGRICLEEAILATNNHVGPSTISFNVQGNINLGLDLPAIEGDGGVTLLGSGIFLVGDGATYGLTLRSPNNVVDGFIIGEFTGDAILVSTADAYNNHIRSCLIGTDGETLRYNAGSGIIVEAGAHDNIIGVRPPDGKGEPNLDEANLISGNAYGISINGAGSDNNIVAGNTIGLNEAADQTIGNGYGIQIYGGASNNLIGGSTDDGTGNVISGNSTGVLVDGEGTNANTIAGNRIGLAPEGNATFGNTTDGVHVSTGAANTVIGGTATTARNYIAGNGQAGVHLATAGSGTQLLNNYIGIAPDGETSASNLYGIFSESNTPGATIGQPDAGNVISGNGKQGVLISASGTDINIKSNIIGLAANGVDAASNGIEGIYISGTDSVVIGGAADGERNVIAANATGILLEDSSGADIKGNLVGVSAAGVANGNFGPGIYLLGADSNTIGGATAGAANVICSNSGPGIALEGSASNTNRIIGNYIGVLADGDTARGNTGAGVEIDGGATGNDIGGSVAGEGNVIGANVEYGVSIVGSSPNNRIQGNIIGRDALSGVGAGNVQAGILVSGGSTQTLIGAARSENCAYNPASPPVVPGINIIALNVGSGVVISGPSTSSNRIRVNQIHDNVGEGIELVGGANNGATAPTVTVLDSPTPGLDLIRVNGAPNSTVDVYADAEDQGEIYLATCTISVTGSVFFQTDAPALEGNYAFTVVTTSASGNSSPFGTAGSLIPDNTLPVIDVSGIGDLLHECGTSFEAPGASISDNSGLIGEFGVELDNFDADTPGDYTITYFAEDPTGNRAEAEVQVTVQDTTDPEVQLVGGAAINWPCFTEYVDPGVSLADLCSDVDDLLVAIDDSEVNTSLPGVYDVDITVTDGSGNVAVITRSVAVDAIDCTDVYVSPSGSNETGDSTDDTPWRTIGFAMTKVAPFAALAPVTVHAKAGDYLETVVMVENTRLLGEGQAVTKILPTIGQLSTSPSVAIRGANNATLESLSVELPFEAPNTRMVSIVDAAMTVRDVELFGRQVPDSIGVFVRGEASSDTLVKDCRIRSVGIGLDIAFSAARFAFNDFENINGEAAIKISESTGATPVVGNLTDLVTSGSNTFTNVSAVFIKSDNPAATSAQANSWENLAEESLVNQLIDGTADVTKPLFTLGDIDDKGIFAATVFVTVVDDDTDQEVNGADVTIVPTKVSLPEANDTGVYSATISAGRYTFRVRKTGYDEQVEIQDIDSGTNAFTIRLGASAGEGEGEPTVPLIHTGDFGGDGEFNLSELLRVVQLYNGGTGFSCGSGEDGFQLGTSGGQTCQPHGADYSGGEPNWKITLTELLRIVQFFNLGGYYRCTNGGSEDGYCPGSP